MGRVIRDAVAADASACSTICAPYVRSTAITFETETPDPEVMAARIATAQRRHAWLVCVEGEGEGEEVLGYAYAHDFAERRLPVVVRGQRRHRSGPARQGAGRDPYGALLTRLDERGFKRAVARIAVPNDPSIRLHERFGFVRVGRFRRIGWKHDRWHDVELMQRDLGADGPPAGIPETA